LAKQYTFMIQRLIALKLILDYFWRLLIGLKR